MLGVSLRAGLSATSPPPEPCLSSSCLTFPGVRAFRCYPSRTIPQLSDLLWTNSGDGDVTLARIGGRK